MKNNINKVIFDIALEKQNVTNRFNESVLFIKQSIKKSTLNFILNKVSESLLFTQNYKDFTVIDKIVDNLNYEQNSWERLYSLYSKEYNVIKWPEQSYIDAIKARLYLSENVRYFYQAKYYEKLSFILALAYSTKYGNNVAKYYLGKCLISLFSDLPKKYQEDACIIKGLDLGKSLIQDAINIFNNVEQNSVALFYLGLDYFERNEFLKAKEKFLDSANLDNPQAYFYLYIMNGCKNFCSLLQKSADLGFEKAKIILANQQQDDRLRKASLLKIAKGKNLFCKEGYRIVGNSEINDVNRNKEAIEFLKISGKVGCVQAYFDLGKAFLEEKNYHKSIKYFLKFGLYGTPIGYIHAGSLLIELNLRKEALNCYIESIKSGNFYLNFSNYSLIKTISKKVVFPLDEYLENIVSIIKS